MKYVSRKINGKRIDEHRRIMQEYLGRELTFDEIVHHKDGDKSNNELSNLQLMTRSEHSRMHNLENKSYEHMLKEEFNKNKSERFLNHKSISKRVGRYSREGELLQEYLSTKDAERKDGYNNAHISSCCNGKRKTHGGFIWRYLE